LTLRRSTMFCNAPCRFEQSEALRDGKYGAGCFGIAVHRYRRASVQVRVRVTRNAVISHPAIQVGFLPVRVSTRHLRPIPECRLRVKTEKAPCEHMFSTLLLRADIAQRSRHVRFVPKPEVTSLIQSPRQRGREGTRGLPGRAISPS
jgi:hypothetical protein